MQVIGDVDARLDEGKNVGMNRVRVPRPKSSSTNAPTIPSGPPSRCPRSTTSASA
jgi:hypothetical protein